MKSLRVDLVWLILQIKLTCLEAFGHKTWWGAISGSSIPSGSRSQGCKHSEAFPPVFEASSRVLKSDAGEFLTLDHFKALLFWQKFA